MLTYKATQSSFHIVDSLVSLPEEDDSDWEYLANSHGDHYDGGSESSPSYFSDDEREMSLSPLPLRTRRQLCENGGVASGRGEEVDYLQDDIEVGYLSTRKVPTTMKDVEQGESPSPVEERVDGKCVVGWGLTLTAISCLSFDQVKVHIPYSIVSAHSRGI